MKPERFEKRRKSILQRARQERFDFQPVQVATEDRGRVVIRALYGLTKGIPVSSLLVLRHQGRYLASKPRVEDCDILQYQADNVGHPWGPKQFLQKLFDLVGAYAGEVDIFFIHSEQLMSVDAESFRAWAQRSREQPEIALTEPLKLLGMENPEKIQRASEENPEKIDPPEK
jgi:hypothetical protein